MKLLDTVIQDSTDTAIPVNVLTGFLGSGKTTLLQHLLRASNMQRTVVLINEFGEIGLDHLLVERVDESVVLLQSGCICCSIRDDLSGALRSLLTRRDQAQIPDFDRVVIETTGLADPAPILYTLAAEPVVRHHFRLANVITTVDAVNAALHLSRNPEGLKQVAPPIVWSSRRRISLGPLRLRRYKRRSRGSIHPRRYSMPGTPGST